MIDGVLDFDGLPFIEKEHVLSLVGLGAERLELAYGLEKGRIQGTFAQGMVDDQHLRLLHSWSFLRGSQEGLSVFRHFDVQVVQKAGQG